MNKKLISFLSLCSLTVTLTACSSNSSVNNTSENSTSINGAKLETIGEIDTYIDLNGNISIDGEGASVDKNTVTINSVGTYSVSGTLSDGQLIVDAGDKDDVYIVLDNANITCSNNSPINIINGNKVILSTADDSENNISDGEEYELEENTDEPNAAIFSKSDLVIMGEGSLNIKGNYNNGITSKDDLIIQSGDIVVDAVNHGIKGKDCVVILDGNIKITSDGDAIKSTNTEDADRGYVQIEGGSIDITSGEDGIQAETDLIINDGDINISTGGGSENASTKEGWGDWGPVNPKGQNVTTDDTDQEESAKGIKASNSIEINGGKLNIDSSDDSIHSNGSIKIKDTDANIKSGDDGIHSDATLEISGGDIAISKSYEGIESQEITFSGGNINITASDDGVNVSGGNDNSSQNRAGANPFESDEDAKLTISGGTIVVDASGDGLDSNGTIDITDGLVVVNGPTNGGNGSLDYGSSFNISGGTLIAAGSSGMLQNPSDTSEQNVISTVLTSQSKDTLVHIEDQDGNELITFSPSKEYASIIVSSPDIKDDSTYKVYVGGKYDGESENGIYSGGTYSAGEEVGSVEISSSINQLVQEGASSSGNMGPGGGMNPGGNGSNKRGMGKSF
ncbi:MAG: carbohydrate-binding domain-containing protein [Intestinibacter sp.]|uniref:carbohydrate-binding domain-containing protein n=1 Tax=Intestinibacter sp. TaxID=1965304 RepID=UPI003F18EF2F